MQVPHLVAGTARDTWLNIVAYDYDATSGLAGSTRPVWMSATTAIQGLETQIPQAVPSIDGEAMRRVVMTLLRVIAGSRMVLQGLWTRRYGIAKSGSKVPVVEYGVGNMSSDFSDILAFEAASLTHWQARQHPFIGSLVRHSLPLVSIMTMFTTARDGSVQLD